MDNRRLLLAALLSMAVLFVWNEIFPPPEPVRPPAPPTIEESAAEAAPAAARGEAATAAAEPPPEADATEEAPEAAAIAASSEERHTLENGWLRVEFTNRGAQLVSVALLQKVDRDGVPLELVQPRSTTPYPFALVDAGGAPLATEAALYAVDADQVGRQLTFTYRGTEGFAEKRFRLLDDGRLDYEIAARPTGGAGWGALLGPGARARADEAETRFNRRAAVWQAGGEVEVLDAGDDEEPTRLPGRGVDWVGLEDTYFLAAAIPDAGLAEVRLEPVVLVPGDDDATLDAEAITGGELTAAQKDLTRELLVVLVADGETTSGTSFWGAKQYDRLASFPWGLERTVRWGWLGFLARPMLRALQWIHAHVTPNYGWAIVWLTVALKIVLLPLSIASFKSMRKMQKLQPKMQAIRERWRPKLRDKQGRYNAEAQKKMNEEVMGLYRQEGVNPAGGCLPMLVQLPIFFAFYTLLSTAVELWHSPWAFWVHDLTVPDPYKVLPIVMGITQFAQTKMTPAPPDPVQKRLMQAMPIVFTFFSLAFPAGLVLYWLTNNVLTIGQQAFYNRIRERAEQEEAAAAKAAKKAKKGRKE